MLDTATSSMSFDRLKGIRGERKVVEAGKGAAVEKLLEVGRSFVDADFDYKLMEDPSEYHLKLYKVVENALDGVDFSVNDLATLVFALSNNECIRLEKEVRGCYTGALLELYTDRMRGTGTKARVHIDGKGAKFNYLFAHARSVDDLLLENFRGDGIANKMGAGGGIYRAVFRNIEGSGLLAYSMLERGGWADTVMFIGCRVDNIFHSKDLSGKVRCLVMAGNEGRLNFFSVPGVIEASLITRNKGIMGSPQISFDTLNCVIAMSYNEMEGPSFLPPKSKTKLLVMDSNKGHVHRAPINYADLAYISNHRGSAGILNAPADGRRFKGGTPLLLVSQNNHDDSGKPWYEGGDFCAIENMERRKATYGPGFCRNIMKAYSLAEIAALSRVYSDDPAVLEAAVLKIRDIYIDGRPVDDRMLSEAIDDAAYHAK